ncbi:MAG: hypothetical protein ABWY06_07890 [Pseudomonas sp.]|uniref:hypothetical protein n=1 Tax=Pseudomonas sp. TaxID=306 RepID=UPI003396BBEF
MTGYRSPGPLGSASSQRVPVDPGTLARTASPTPGPFAAGAVSAPPAPPAAAAVDSQTPRAIDIEKAVVKILAIALSDYSGKCATHVRRALQAGGGDLSQNPTYAKDYGPTLLGLGFTTVPNEGYTPKKGDVVVFEDYKGQASPAGHIQMYSGSHWVSDMKQPRFLAHRRNYVGVPYVIYRP